MEDYRRIMDVVGTAIDGIGVFVIIAGALVATVRLVSIASRRQAITIRFIVRMSDARSCSASSFL